MAIDNYSDLDATALAELVRKGETTPTEVLEEAISRAERHNPKLNAITYKAFDEARAAAKGDLPDGPFKGVPFLIKDIASPVKGWPQTSGSRFLRDVVAAEDGALTRRFREAGLNLFGKTNTPEFGITGTTEGAFHGACHNPWNTDYITGGSSGGAAAMVAAGVLPMAHASDGLGSIRIPAACCGLFGMKTTRDRNPNSAYDDAAAIGLTVEHAVTRSVRDSAALLDATAYPEPGAPFAYPAKSRPFAEEVGAAPGKLRIAFHSETPSGKPVHPEIRAALEQAAKLLESLGHHVEEHGLGIDYRRLYTAQRAVSGSNFAATVDAAIKAQGREPREDELEPLTWRNYRGSKHLTGSEAMAGWSTLRKMSRQILGLHETYDIILSPVLGEPVPKIGEIDPVNMDPRDVDRRQAQVFPFTPPQNITGQPSMSVPMGRDSNGLPIGMMFSGRYGDEATLFRLAAQLEETSPWQNLRPPVWG
ncbi:amidase [Henriciella litoralis]|uniref:amidase n=1 Tax=Henriciella litoralis TaxID=568102 RepID=UPI000A011D55|nr:amidase family protein [Henriciella litoralis]